MGEFCESMAADTRSARQKEGLTTAINALLASNLPGPLTAENLGAAKDSLVNAIAATYPDATDKLQAFIDALASHMGEAYPLETYKSPFYFFFQYFIAGLTQLL